MWYVYILLCKDGSFYTGASSDPQKRFTAHKKGVGTRYTRSHKPIKIVYLEKLSTKQDALKREIQIKRLPKKKKTDLITHNTLIQSTP